VDGRRSTGELRSSTHAPIGGVPIGGVSIGTCIDRRRIDRRRIDRRRSRSAVTVRPIRRTARRRPNRPAASWPTVNWPTIGAYWMLFVVSIMTLTGHPTGAWRYPVVLLPMIPAATIPFLVVRALRRMDELERRIQLEALAFAFAGTGILTFGYGFLQLVGLPDLRWLFVWPLMAGLWLVGLLVSTRRYR
jgi:hypothetical protein